MNMLTVLVVLGLTAVALASECGPMQRIKVKHQWADVYGVDGDREGFATDVWKHYFADHPDRTLFESVRGDNIYSPEFRAHMVRVFAGVDLLISVLDDDDTFKAATAHYAKFHKKFGDIPFENMGHALLEELPSHLHGNVFDFDAWNACYDVIAKALHG